MNKSHKKIIRKYIRQVTRYFPAFYSGKRRIILELKEGLERYCVEHQEFTMEVLCNEFGSPQEYIDSVLANTSADEMRQIVRMKKRSVFVIALISVLIIGVGIAATVTIIEVTSHFATSHYTEIEEIECNTIPDESLSNIDNK